MAISKKTVKYFLIGGGVIVVAVVIYKVTSISSANRAAALRNQQLAAAAKTSIPGNGSPIASRSSAGMIAPLIPVGLANTDPNDPANITITATSAPSSSGAFAI